MMRGALHEEVKQPQVYNPATVVAALTDWTQTTQAAASGIDLQGYDEAVIELNLGTIASGTLDVDFFESATDVATAATAIVDADGNAADFDQKAAANSDNGYVARIKAKDRKRYLFIRVTNSSSGSKTFGINVLLAKADKEPVTQDNTVDYADGSPA